MDFLLDLEIGENAMEFVDLRRSRVMSRSLLITHQTVVTMA